MFSIILKAQFRRLVSEYSLMTQMALLHRNLTNVTCLQFLGSYTYIRHSIINPRYNTNTKLMRSFIQLFVCSTVCAHKVRAIGFLCDARCDLVPNTGTGCRILAPPKALRKSPVSITHGHATRRCISKENHQHFLH